MSEGHKCFEKQVGKGDSAGEGIAILPRVAKERGNVFGENITLS